ncbi:hypothetical protein ACFL0W_01160 [Nanoarchaeota archaeon]
MADVNIKINKAQIINFQPADKTFQLIITYIEGIERKVGLNLNINDLNDSRGITEQIINSLKDSAQKRHSTVDLDPDDPLAGYFSVNIEGEEVEEKMAFALQNMKNKISNIACQRNLPNFNISEQVNKLEHKF